MDVINESAKRVLFTYVDDQFGMSLFAYKHIILCVTADKKEKVINNSKYAVS